MNRDIKTLCCTIYSFILLVHSPLMSQDIKLIGFDFTRFPTAGIKDSPIDQEVEVNEYNFFINLPKLLKNEKTVLVNGFRYKLVTPYTDNDIGLGVGGQDFHIIGYRFTVLHDLGNNWNTLLSLNPVLSSTFSTSLEGGDFLFNGALQFTKKKSERLSYGAGLTITSRFGEPLLLPIAQFTLKSEKSKFKVLLPRDIGYERYFGNLTAGIEMSVDGSLYNVNYSVTTDLGELAPIDKLGYTRVLFGPNLSLRVGKILQVEAAGGITLARRVDLGSDAVEDIRTEVDNSPFFRFGIAIVPPKKDK